MDKILNLLSKIRKNRSGILTAYLLSLFFAYQFIWRMIEPLVDLPTEISTESLSILRITLHILFSLFFAAHISLILAWSVYQSPNKNQVLEADIERLELKVDVATDQLLETIRQREILRNGIYLLKDEDLANEGIAALFTLSTNMPELSENLSQAVKFTLIETAISLACADNNFAPKEKETIERIGRKYGLNEIETKEIILSNETRIGH